MNPAKKQTCRNQAGQIIEALNKRNMKGVYFDNHEDAVDAICKMIPSGSLVGLGGSETIIETGLVDALRKLDIRLLDRYKEGVTKEDVDAMRREGLLSDVYIASSNAITADGKIVNQDGIGNRVAAMIYGPRKVIKTVEDAVSRIKTVAGPMDSIRVGKDTPCARLGFCNDPHCHPPQRICSQLVIIESSLIPDRTTVVLIGEDLGY
jgi:hypothetical protein